ncbi:TetR/AcrR family transcriptional regulator [Kitasatospora sp. NBC_01250]|uniref:TetR family transcriptional regulator n=1 Tax=unclassified Kitasatospora TaxID=2633591 RepID=UPI002E0EEAE3|nr:MULTISPECIES: TetR family transcriptional regulator [unclassified Kitasatospora]WSJ66202.1 TetR/AcrR family transcriptional regulator [Kitasatospora sp. NBC_01302]
MTDRPAPTEQAAPADRPSLTDRRRAATQLEIATTAAALFAERGAEATSAEEIARASGVALRTFYRYFRTKEEAVAPLLAAGGQRWLASITAAPAGLAVPEVLERAAVEALTPADARAAEALRWTRALLTDPGLRRIWQAVHQDSEDALVPILAERCGAGVDPLEVRLVAAAATAAIRVALESWAAAPEPAEGPAAPGPLAARCLRELTAGLRLFDGATG